MKYFGFVLLLVIVFSDVHAQFVPISNKYLRETIKEMFPNCVSINDELDTTCSSLLAVDTLTLLWKLDNFENEIDMSSLKYFRNLDSLALIFYRTTSLNILLDFKESPSSLKKLSTTNRSFDIPTTSWNFNNLPQGLEEYYGQAEIIRFSSDVPNLKKIKVEYDPSLYSDGGGAVNLFFVDSILPDKVEELEMKQAVFWFKPKVSTSLKQLRLEDIYLSKGISFNEFMMKLPDGLTDLSLEYINTDTLYFFKKLPLSLKNLYAIAYPKQILSEISLPSNLKTLYLDGGMSKINPLPDSITSITILNHVLENPLETFTTLPQSLRYFKLRNTPMLMVPDLPFGTFSFEASKAQLQSIGMLSPTLQELRVSVNDIRSLPSLPQNLRVLDVQGNPNLSCLPILNDSLRTLVLGSNPTIKCIPNETKYILATVNRPICTNSDSICEDVAFVKGVLYYDLNANETLDSSDLRLSGGLISSLPAGLHSVTGKDGAYTLVMQPDAINNISATYNNPYANGIIPSSHLITTSAVGEIFTNYNFGVTFRPAYDLESYLVSTSQRPGFSSTITATVLNRTTTNYDNATLKVYCADAWSIIATYPSASRILNDTVIWDNISLSEFQSKQFEIVTYLSPTIPLGTEKTYYSEASSVLTDETPVNNTFQLKEIIRGSYDPNDKLVNQLTIPSNYDESTELIYTIRFQNTGTDTAFNVVIKDSILSQLDPLSFRTISSNHNYSMEYKDNGVIFFNFFNILLPDSTTNEPESHGYILLAIKPTQSLPSGTVITNDASIYFDFNAPIVTEQAKTEININVSVLNQEKINLNVYPNPSKDLLYISHDEVGEIRLNIFNIEGKLVFSKITQQNITEIPVHQLPSGVYLLRADSSQGAAVFKILIQR